MPWEGHQFTFVIGETMGSNYAACTCGWKTGYYGESPKRTWLEQHMSKKIRKGLAFHHVEDDIHYDFEDKETWCECGWAGEAGPDYYQRGQEHLQKMRRLEHA